LLQRRTKPMPVKILRLFGVLAAIMSTVSTAQAQA
jgi:hypothetical protein